MNNTKRTRVQNSNKYLTSFLKEGESFFVGITFEEFVKSAKLNKYGLNQNFAEGKSILPNAVRSTSKANIKGKWVRVHPEEKEEVVKHIKYIRQKDNRMVEFDRMYYIYKKEFDHQLNATFNFITNKHGEKIVISERLTFLRDIAITNKNTHIINLFCEVFNTFEILTTEYEFALHFNKRFELDLLPKGNLSDKVAFEKIASIAKHYTRNVTEQQAFLKRLSILQEYSPDIRGKGPNNLFGYIVFEFTDLEIVILETMYSDNATYVFRIKGYENDIIKDKTTVLKDKLLLKRFYHRKNWEANVRNFIEGLKKVKHS